MSVTASGNAAEAGGFALSTWRAYLALTKPTIIELLLVTTIPTMFLAAQGFPPFSLMFWTLIGGSLAAGGANALNCYLDRDIDAIMQRTAHRPLATGQIAPYKIILFGLTLSFLSFLVLGLAVNPLSAFLATIAILFYVVGYTMILKRRTPQNIVWGGAAGCMPVLIGWSAVTNSLSWTPVVLFLIVFFWTPPHYWPLSLRFRNDYAAANVPMLPVEEPPHVVAKQIVIYGFVMVATSLVLIPVANMNWLYTVTAVASGIWFMQEAFKLQNRVKQDVAELHPMRLFHLSISYLSVLFLAVGIDPFLG